MPDKLLWFASSLHYLDWKLMIALFQIFYGLTGYASGGFHLDAFVLKHIQCLNFLLWDSAYSQLWTTIGKFLTCMVFFGFICFKSHKKHQTVLKNPENLLEHISILKLLFLTMVIHRLSWIYQKSTTWIYVYTFSSFICPNGVLVGPKLVLQLVTTNKEIHLFPTCPSPPRKIDSC